MHSHMDAYDSIHSSLRCHGIKPNLVSAPGYYLGARLSQLTVPRVDSEIAIRIQSDANTVHRKCKNLSCIPTARDNCHAHCTWSCKAKQKDELSLVSQVPHHSLQAPPCQIWTGGANTIECTVLVIFGILQDMRQLSISKHLFCWNQVIIEYFDTTELVS